MRVQGAVSVLDLVGRREMVEKLVAQCEARLAQEHKLAEEEMGGAVRALAVTARAVRSAARGGCRWAAWRKSCWALCPKAGSGAVAD